MRISHIGTLGLCLAVWASSLPSRADAPQAPDIGVRAPQAVLMEADTGAILFQRNAEKLVSPGGLSQLALLAVVFKALKDGEVKPTDEYLVTEYAWRKGGAPSGTSAMFVPIGTREKLEDLLKGVIVQSGNDAAIAIAENMAGSENAFAGRMTEEARRIGLKKSTFKNATGF